eukprot:scaffold23436_cov68-Phaeocystis_antarctica.AAC.10
MFRGARGRPSTVPPGPRGARAVPGVRCRVSAVWRVRTCTLQLAFSLSSRTALPRPHVTPPHFPLIEPNT